MVTRRRMLQGTAALALLTPLGKNFGKGTEQGNGPAKDPALAAQAAQATGGGYVPVTDPLVQAKLAQWADWKFGIILHWGLYSELGIVESWTLCSEDWIKRPGNAPYVAWKQRYEKLRTTFDPTQFDPAQWAEAAHAAGMRYVVFTTKHHDGFCMFNTAQTDYRVTASDVPFHSNPRANVAKAVFDAFRRRGFGIGAYFSKADWHHPDYWSPLWATPTRNNNYDVAKYPGMWQRFVDYTHAQIRELTTQYGRVDLMWLDAGWVNPRPHPDAKAYTSEVPWAQDIDMPALAAIARSNQPGIVLVNRADGGPYENYRTPEQTVPDRPLPYPWETCMTMGGSWSWNPHDHYKSPRELVHLLVGIVAKGGNLLLGIGPKGDGQLPAEAVRACAPSARGCRSTVRPSTAAAPSRPMPKASSASPRARTAASTRSGSPTKAKRSRRPASCCARCDLRRARACRCWAPTRCWHGSRAPTASTSNCRRPCAASWRVRWRGRCTCRRCGPE